jgi:hypothetical protein
MITLQDVKKAQEGENWKPYVVQSLRGKKNSWLPNVF